MTTLTMTKTQPKLVASLIEQNILGVLNTRLGTVPIRTDMGLPDLRGLYHLNQPQLNSMAQIIVKQLQQFEPRLQNFTVECALSNTHKAAFQITISGTQRDSNTSFNKVLFCLTNGKIAIAS